MFTTAGITPRRIAAYPSDGAPDRAGAAAAPSRGLGAPPLRPASRLPLPGRRTPSSDRWAPRSAAGPGGSDDRPAFEAKATARAPRTVPAARSAAPVAVRIGRKVSGFEDFATTLIGAPDPRGGGRVASVPEKN